MSDPHAAQLVLAIVRRRWNDAERLAGSPRTDPGAFLAQCHECDVQAWVHHLLTSEGRGDLLGSETLEALATERARIRNATMLLLARAEQALDALLGVGVKPLALKGLDFLHRLYPTVDLRTVEDIDILVRQSDLAAALSALREAGWELPPEPEATHYIRSSHHLPLRLPGPIPLDLELHWNLAQSERYSIDADALFDRAPALDVAGRPVLRLEDHDAVAHLLIHHFSHYFDRRLKWLIDLQRISEECAIDWNRVSEVVGTWDGRAAAAISLTHLAKLGPGVIPVDATRVLRVGWWRLALTAPLRSKHPLEMFRGTGRRRVHKFLAAVMLEHPSQLPAWVRHRARRDKRPTDHPLDDGEDRVTNRSRL